MLFNLSDNVITPANKPEPNMNAKQITCRRCKGSGNVGGPVLFAGQPGGCFNCACTGKMYVDKFDQQYARAKGEFYGFTYVINGATVKQIGRVEKHDLLVSRGTAVAEITEDQARKFFAKYGERTTLAAK